MFAPFRSHATTYGQVHVETGVANADPHRLVTMLFDGALSNIVNARGALQRRDIEIKANSLCKAVRIVDEGLRAALNREQGGELAANLNNLYSYIIARLTHANLRNDDAALKECHELLSSVRDAWVTMKPTQAAA